MPAVLKPVLAVLASLSIVVFAVSGLFAQQPAHDISAPSVVARQIPNNVMHDEPARERELMERIATLEANNARLVAANAVQANTLNAANQRLATQDGQIRELIADMAELTQQAAELREALIETTAQRERMTNQVRRLVEQLRACEAERDALAAELAALRGG